MKIDTQNGWYRGLGDLVCFAWLGAGMLAASQPIEFAATGWRAEVLRLFDMPVTEDFSDAVVAHEGYETVIRTGSLASYLEWIAEQHGIMATPVRPRLDLPPMDREYGREASARVLIFPDTSALTRRWPANYYLELAAIMRDAGIEVAIATAEPDGVWSAFRCLAGQSIAFVAAACQAAELVIGNDSGPAHLAATIGTPVLAILGPTTPRIFRHLPEVTSYEVSALDCAGCHYLTPFRASCKLGCHELYRTLPGDVFAAVMKQLGGNASAWPAQLQKGGRRG